MTEEATQLIQGCRHNSTMLLNLINDLLDLAKSENLTFRLNKQYFNLGDSIKEAFETLRFISEPRNIKTSIEIKKSDEKYFEALYGDSNRFQQIFLNFFSNSLKFTAPGGAVVVKLSIKSCHRIDEA